VASTPEEIIVSIQDQGEGISSEHLPHIFEPFYRIPRERERRVAGSGLGLFICRGLVEAHGGTIWAESRPDEGTRVSFTLPRH
jgi:signal transduction histidine kinase